MWPNPRENPDLATFTEEILSGKLHFLCSDRYENLLISTSFSHKNNMPTISHNNTFYFLRLLFTFRDMLTRIHEIFVDKHVETIEYVKNGLPSGKSFSRNYFFARKFSKYFFFTQKLKFSRFYEDISPV